MSKISILLFDKFHHIFFHRKLTKMDALDKKLKITKGTTMDTYSLFHDYYFSMTGLRHPYLGKQQCKTIEEKRIEEKKQYNEIPFSLRRRRRLVPLKSVKQPKQTKDKLKGRRLIESDSSSDDEHCCTYCRNNTRRRG